MRAFSRFLAVCLKLLLGAFVLWQAATLSHAAHAAHAADGPEGKGTCTRLRLTGPQEYPPLSWGENGQLEGAGFDLARQVAKRAGVDIEIVPLGPWPRTYARVAAGEVDMLVSLYRISERQQALIYLPAWAQENTLVIMNKQRAFPFSRWEDLIGHPGAAARGDSGGERFDQFARDHLTLIRTPTQKNMFAMLTAGRIDYVIVGEYSPFAPRFRNPASDYVVARMPVDSHQVHMAVSRKSACAGLASRLSVALSALVADGTADTLVERYSHTYARGR